MRLGRQRAYTSFMRWIPLLLLSAPLWASDARDAVEAARLFDDGQAMMQAGRYGAASVTFRTLLYVYPESDVAPQARQELRKSEDLEAQAPVVRSLRFQLGGAVSLEEIRDYFAAREVVLSLEQRYEARDVERARLALEDLLAEQGKKGTVKATVRPARRQSVEVLFTLAKK